MKIDYCQSQVTANLFEVVLLGKNLENLPQNWATISIKYHLLKMGPMKLMKFSQLPNINANRSYTKFGYRIIILSCGFGEKT